MPFWGGDTRLVAHWLIDNEFGRGGGVLHVVLTLHCKARTRRAVARRHVVVDGLVPARETEIYLFTDR
jgi:hypothetical protein